MFTTRPLREVRRWGRAVRVASQVPRTFTAITRSHVSGSSSSSVLPPEVVIAPLFTSPSRPSSAAAAALTQAAIDALEARSSGTKTAPISLAVARPASSRTSATATRAPAAIAASANARPSPRAPPVMRMRRSRNMWVLKVLPGKSIDLDEQALALAFHRVTDKVAPPRLLRALAGRNVEPRAVQRTLDLIAFDKTLGKQRICMRTNIFHRVVAVADLVDADLTLTDLCRDRRVIAQVARRSYVVPPVHSSLMFH